MSKTRIGLMMVGCVLLGVLPLGRFSESRAYVVPVIDGANLVQRYIEISQRARQLSLSLQKLYRLYEIRSRLQETVGRLGDIRRSWETNLIQWAVDQLASEGVFVDAWVLEELLHDLDELMMDLAHGVSYRQENGGDLLGTYPGFSLSVEPEPWIQVESEATEATLETHQALLAMIKRASDASTYLAEERIGAEELLMESEGTVQTQQLQGLLIGNLGDELQRQGHLLAAVANAITVDSAHRIHREGRYLEAVYLWLEADSPTPAAFQGSRRFLDGRYIP